MLQDVAAGKAGKGCCEVGSGRIPYYPELALPDCIKSRNYRVSREDSKAILLEFDVGTLTNRL
jgi:hypothetical protein